MYFAIDNIIYRFTHGKFSFSIYWKLIFWNTMVGNFDKKLTFKGNVINKAQPQK